MLLAAFFGLVLGSLMIAKALAARAAKKPYVFSFADGGLWLRGAEVRPAIPLGVGAGLFALGLYALAALAYEPLLHPIESWQKAARVRGSACSAIVTLDELRGLGSETPDESNAKPSDTVYECSRWITTTNVRSYAMITVERGGLASARTWLQQTCGNEAEEPVANLGDGAALIRGRCDYDNLIVARGTHVLRLGLAHKAFPPGALAKLAEVIRPRLPLMDNYR